MNDKYELTDKTRQFNWVKLYQIKAKRNFSYVCKWELGGWIETEDNLSKYGDSWVSENARVSDGAWVSGDARVSGEACVSDNASVSGDARVSGNAMVWGDARVSDGAWVSGDARVCEDACVSGDAWVSGDARVCGKFNYTKWKFIWWDDTDKITRIEDKMWNDYWKAQYVLGDYEITEQKVEENKTTVTLELTQEELEKIKELIK